MFQNGYLIILSSSEYFRRCTIFLFLPIQALGADPHPAACSFPSRRTVLPRRFPYEVAKYLRQPLSAPEARVFRNIREREIRMREQIFTSFQAKAVYIRRDRFSCS